MMRVDIQRVFRASMHCLPEATAFVENYCNSHGVAHNDTLRLALIVEELFTNTVVHGHGGDGDSTVRLELTVGKGQLELLYEDAAPQFDLLAHLDQAAPDLNTEIGDRPLGGLGLALVAQMASSLSYAREYGLNRLRLVLRRQS